MMATLTLCRTCPTGEPDLDSKLDAALKAEGLTALIQGVDCMSGCTQPPTLAVRQSGKTAYLFGEITSSDLPDLITFLRMYDASADGNFADARPLGALRFKAIARIPARIAE